MGHGFKHGAGGSAKGTTGTLVVNAPAGVTAIANKEDKTYTKIVNEDGVAIFKGLSTGEWTVTIDNGEQTSTQTIRVTLDYSVVMAFFASTISVTYPSGAICTCSDGNTTITATDTSGNYMFTVPNTGSWTIFITDGNQERSRVIEITSDGESQNIIIAFFAATIDVTYPEGSICTCTCGDTTITAPDTSGHYVFTVPSVGTWTISSTDGIESASEDVVITSDEQTENVTLSYWNGYLFDNGDQFTNVTGGWINSTGAEIKNTLIGEAYVASSFGSYVRTVNKIDLSEFSTLTVNFTKASNNNSIAIDDDSDTIGRAVDLAAMITISKAGEASLDVSTFSGEYYVFVVSGVCGGNACSFTADKVWLS